MSNQELEKSFQAPSKENSKTMHGLIERIEQIFESSEDLFTRIAKIRVAIQESLLDRKEVIKVTPHEIKRTALEEWDSPENMPQGNTGVLNERFEEIINSVHDEKEIA
ncbi:MAG TPA: hypothetical protein ENI70_01840 [Candidatus Peregrinibacteria bacterium]|nr:hypothetical protein [Candidatus Peregrinibacteria bacterium]